MKKNTFEQKVRDGAKTEIAKTKKEAPAEVKSAKAKLESSDDNKAKKNNGGK